MTQIKTILFVEDDPVDRMSLERMLKGNKDFNFLSTDSLTKAIEILEIEPLDVIVSDYRLGDGFGTELIHKYPDIPLIVITGTSDIELAVAAMKAGAYDFLIKDIDRAYLQLITLSCQEAIKRKNQELHLAKLNQAVEQNPNLILITDVEGIIEYVNPKYLEVTGYDLDEIIGKSILFFGSGYHDPEFYTELWDTIKSGKKWTNEFYNKTKNGEYYWEFASIAPLFNKAGKITHFIKVGENITELKKAEEERLEKSKLQTVLEMAGTMSHEFNQPLQIILGYTELLKEKLNSDDPIVKKQFENIRKNIDRMLETSEKLNNITKYKTIPYLDKGVILDIHSPDSE